MSTYSEQVYDEMTVELRARVTELEAFARSVRDGFDHDEDAHRYNTFCRVCEAEKTLAPRPSVSTGPISDASFEAMALAWMAELCGGDPDDSDGSEAPRIEGGCKSCAASLAALLRRVATGTGCVEPKR